MRTLLIVGALGLLGGCAAKRPVPAFTERHCPEGSVRHVTCYAPTDLQATFCGPREKGGNGGSLIEICQDTKTQGLLAMGSACNPYMDTDCDEGEDKAHPHSWWKFWLKGKDYKDND
jgi:hypothetical protein